MLGLRRIAWLVPLCMSALLFSTSASAQVLQTLDRTQVNSADAVIEMDFADIEPGDFFDTRIRAESEFTTCKLTAIEGLYCLDGKIVRNWPTTADPATSIPIIDCEDPALNLDTKKADTCTGLTVGLSGVKWIAGKNKGKTHSLIKAVEKASDGSCPPGFSELERLGRDYCADEVATGRPLLVDINVIDGDVAEAFPRSKGILGLEERKSIVFFPDALPSSPIVIASGKRELPLAGNEQLSSVALWQSPDGAVNRIFVVTDRGRILSVPILAGGSVGTITEAFDVPTRRGMRQEQDPVPSLCSSEDAAFAIRASSKSGLIYVTDREYCEVLALEPVDPGSTISVLTEVQQSVTRCEGSLADAPPCGEGVAEITVGADLTLSTDGAAGTFPPQAPTVAPGIGVDLRNCAGTCSLVAGPEGGTAFSLSSVELVPGSPSGLTLFQIKNMPDCRYIPEACVALLGVPAPSGAVAALIDAGVIVAPGGADDPASQLLNLTPLLPMEITELFDDSGMPPDGLPAMYLSRQYRGQKSRTDAFGNPQPFTFEAFFGITEPGVLFQGVFEAFYDTEGLAGDELGCHAGLPSPSPLSTLLGWDVVTSVSETFRTFTDADLVGDATSGTGIGGIQYVDSLSNVACGSGVGLNKRWSIKPYNLEITPCSRYLGSETIPPWESDGDCPLPPQPSDPPPDNDPTLVNEVPDDAVLAKLLLQLFDDLRESQNQLACTDNVDAPGSDPLSDPDCASLDSAWLNAKDKLDKCWQATQQPKQSSGNQNCQAFEQQFDAYKNTLTAATPSGPDPANRIGELLVRVAVLEFLYFERFEPSIPADGFCEPGNPDRNDAVSPPTCTPAGP